MNKILIIEDEPDIAEGVAENLRVEGYEVALAGTAAEGASLAARFAPDLIILDLMLPDGSGFDLLAGLRSRGDATPTLILSARGAEVDKIRGFRAGADDYVTKPFGLLELMLRVEAILRRVRPKASRVERLGDVEVHFASRQVLRAGSEVALTPKEFDLLVTLLERRGEAVSRQVLLSEVWEYAEDAETRTVDWHIAELRRKLEADPADPRLILTVRKVGYRLAR